MAKKKATAAEILESQEIARNLLRKEEADAAIEKRLVALYTLQSIDSHIDKIRIVRGELPLEVQDLEDEIAGLETRIENFAQEIEDAKNGITERQNLIAESKKLIKKYEAQQNSVRNNREFDSLSKEVEFQELEIQLSEKKIKEYTSLIQNKEEETERAQSILQEKKDDLATKRTELEEITNETEKEEQDLLAKEKEQEQYIEERYLTAYHKLRKAARNGLAVVQIERDACGGCFSKIPHQRQMEIRMHKKIIVCEHCGRILVDESIAAEVPAL